MPTLIYEHRDEYIGALQAVDESQRAADLESVDDQAVEAELTAMVEFLRRMLMKQFRIRDRPPRLSYASGLAPVAGRIA